ncbi:MAG: GWxTD domain-containing protein [Candidatus Krumholzibacteria bacterium]|nr:GWxTD domain-containing protein [Candidatus Krumholzibacteria bacterium]
MLLRTVLIIACWVAAPLAGHAGEVVGGGDFEFFLDAAAYRMADGSTRQDVYLRVPNTGIRFKESKGIYEAKARISVVIRNVAGGEVVDDTGEFKMYVASQEEAVTATRFQTLTKSYSLAEGVYSLSCTIEDRNSPKVTIVGMVRGSYHESAINGYPLEVPTFPADEMSLSDARFLWQVGAAGDESSYLPNPSRLYGLYRDSLRVYVEAYVPRRIISPAGLALRTVVLDEKGAVVTESSVLVPADDTSGSRAGTVASDLITYPFLITEDLNRFPAGSYSLYVNGGVGEQWLVRVHSGNFSVAWDLRTWEVSRSSYIAEARFLLDDEDFDQFASKAIGEQESILQNMWKEIDPDPLTGVNEAYEKFKERLAYVNAKYTDYQLGIFTDRGLIYLKYGPPDEKVVDVIPLNRESMSDALEKVRDRYHAVNFSNTGGRMGYAKPSRDIAVDPRRLGAVGEGGNTAFPYELWLYNNSGDPLIDRDKNLEPDQGLRFIFVDKDGYGRYKLESSSSMSNK